MESAVRDFLAETLRAFLRGVGFGAGAALGVWTFAAALPWLQALRAAIATW